MDKMNFCHSCAAPLNVPDFRGPLEDYCRYCADKHGKIKPRDEVQKGIAEWFKSWQPDVSEKVALDRAEIYMKSMPHWA